MRLIDADALRNEFIIPPDSALLYATVVTRIIDGAPTIDPKPQWIQVVERLPDMQEESSLEYCGFEKSDMVLVTIYNPFGVDITDTARFYRDIDENEWWGDVEEGSDLDVVAWMPLPEPYKPDGNKMEDQE